MGPGKTVRVEARCTRWRRAASFCLPLVATLCAARPAPASPGVLIAGGYTGLYEVSSYFFDPGTGLWTQKGNMGVARARFGGAAMPYLGGSGMLGVGGVPAYTAVEAYSSTTDAWISQAPSPITRWGNSCASLTVGANPGVLVAGGLNLSLLAPTAQTDFFDSTLMVWLAKAPLPLARYQNSLCPVAVGGVAGVLSIGGTATTGGAPSNSVFFYNPVSDAWTTVASLPAPRNFLTSSVVTVGSVTGVLAVGGSSSGGVAAQSTAYFYNPLADGWTTVAPMVWARQEVASAPVTIGAVAGVLVAGGTSGTVTYHGAAEFYDPQANSWTQLSPVPTPRYGLIAAAVSYGTVTPTGSPSGTPTRTPSRSASVTAAASYTPTACATGTAPPSWTSVPTGAATASPSASPSVAPPQTATASPTETGAGTGVATATGTASQTPPPPGLSGTSPPSHTGTGSATPSGTPACEPLRLDRNLARPGEMLAVEYCASSDRDVEIAVWNSAGERIRRLFSGPIARATLLSLRWDLTNEDATPAAGGVYVLTVSSSQSKRLFLRFGVLR